MNKTDIDEKKTRMKRIADTMWHTFNSHNLAEVFRKRPLEELRNPALDELCKKIGGSYNGYTHDLAWALIGLESCADWNQHATGFFGEMVELTIGQISNNDKAAFEAINKAIESLT